MHQSRAACSDTILVGWWCPRGRSTSLTSGQYGNSSLPQRNMYEWITMLKNYRTSANEEERPGRPSTSTIEETTEWVRATILDNRRVTIDEVGHHLRISHGSARGIIQDRLGFHKVCARWVPKQLFLGFFFTFSGWGEAESTWYVGHCWPIGAVGGMRIRSGNRSLTAWAMARPPKQLTGEHKHNRLSICWGLLNHYRNEGDAFLRGNITEDETWTHHYAPESKRQSMTWKHPYRQSEKFKTRRSVEKVMLTLFRDAKRPILDHSQGTGTTVNSVCNSECFGTRWNQLFQPNADDYCQNVSQCCTIMPVRTLPPTPLKASANWTEPSSV
jgi:hypothetical protein